MPKSSSRKKKILVFSQTFAPDPASVGQHITDTAMAMARRGHTVRVYASSRGYEDPSRQYPLKENMQGVDVRRLGLHSLCNKGAIQAAGRIGDANGLPTVRKQACSMGTSMSL